MNDGCDIVMYGCLGGWIPCVARVGIIIPSF